MTTTKVWIVNLWGPAFSGFSKGALSTAFADAAAKFFEDKGCEIKRTNVSEPYTIEAEHEKAQWADVTIYQSPCNWMGMGWEAKKWADEVWTAGMGGQLCKMDGRHRESPEDGYGTGGTLNGKKYLLSLTFNAPKGAFDRPDQYLFQGKSVDDLWFPFHMNQRFFALEQLPTFAAFDVLKNPQIESDMIRFKKHLAEAVPF